LIKSDKPLPSTQYGDPGDVSLVDYATRYLIRLITAYIEKGDPYLLSDPGLRGRALYNQGIIGMNMRQFPICHELMHLVLGHLGSRAPLPRDEAWDHEFLADQGGSSFVAGINAASDRASMITNIWACSVALAGFQMLEEWVTYLYMGSWEVPESDTHPSHRRRRENLFQYQYHSMIRTGNNEDARSLLDLFNKGEEVLRDMWYRVAPYVKELREYGAKPSPIWRTREIFKQ
jgi:hypothetical protein